MHGEAYQIRKYFTILKKLKREIMEEEEEEERREKSEFSLAHVCGINAEGDPGEVKIKFH